MRSALINLENFSIKFSKEPLVKPFDLNIANNGKYCLVGRNGSGKSSLMKVFTGDLDYAHGKIWLKPGLKISYLPQTEDYGTGVKVIDFVKQGLGENQDETLTYKANILLDALKLSADDYVDSLSGGTRRRVSLAKALCGGADLLLLDEPTNHLDIHCIEWLEKYLASYNGAVIIISHDREFLRKSTNHTIWIDRGDVYVNNQGYTAYDDWSALVIEDEINKLRRMEKELEKENLWLAQGVTARRKRNQQRLGNLFKIREEMKQERQKFASFHSKINLGENEQQKSSKIVVELKSISKNFDEKKILENFNLRIIRGDKIAVIGSNGSGKSTLVKIITGEIEPDNGSVYKSPVLDLSYFEQDRTSLDITKTARQILCPGGGDQIMVNGKMRHVIAYLKDFMFSSEKANAVCSLLSGGEQNRLLLARALANPGNFIILDEPTNDLDADTLDMLLEIIADFEGTVMIVSHDRDFLERFVTRTIIFTEDGVEDIIGGYLDYQKESKKKIKDAIPKNADNSKKSSNKDAGLSYKGKFDLESLAKEIPELENKIKDLEKFLAENPNLYSTNQKKFDEILSNLGKLKKDLEEKETKWLDLEIKK